MHVFNICSIVGYEAVSRVLPKLDQFLKNSIIPVSRLAILVTDRKFIALIEVPSIKVATLQVHQGMFTKYFRDADIFETFSRRRRIK